MLCIVQSVWSIENIMMKLINKIWLSHIYDEDKLNEKGFFMLALDKTTTHYNDNIGPEKFLQEMLSSGIIVEQFCKSEQISVKQFEQLAHDVINDWKLTKQTHLSESEAREASNQAKKS